MMKYGKNELKNLLEMLETKTNSQFEKAESNILEKPAPPEFLIQIRTSDFPKRYRDITFSDYQFVGTAEQRAKQELLIQHLQSFRSVLMYGNNGVGKTMLAFASMRDKVEKNMTTLYITLFDLMSEIKESFNPSLGRQTSRIIEKYTDIDYLVIDEIDKSYGTDTDFNYFFRIINRRYNDKKPSVLISNSSDYDIIETVGKSVFERIVEEGVAVNMNWESYRKNRA